MRKALLMLAAAAVALAPATAQGPRYLNPQDVAEAQQQHGIWVHLGSLAVLVDEGKVANRSFVIDRAGNVQARYDKMHLFDVDLPTGESWRESAVYRAGDKVVVVNGTPVGKLGLTICYDLRFPTLFARIAEADADVIAVPAAFTVPTGRAHWHTLLRARAIESQAFVFAAAQGGTHAQVLCAALRRSHRNERGDAGPLFLCWCQLDLRRRYAADGGQPQPRLRRRAIRQARLEAARTGDALG